MVSGKGVFCRRCCSHYTSTHCYISLEGQRLHGVRCEDLLIPALLYADDMVMFAEDEEMLRRALTKLGEWCAEWSVKVNVDKCEIMHMRKKGVNTPIFLMCIIPDQH